MKVKCDHRSKFSNLSNWREELEYVGYFLKNGEAAPKGYRLSNTLVILEGRSMFIVDMTFHDASVRI